MNQKVSKILKYVLSAALAAVLLYFSFRGVDWKEFFVQLKSCNWWYITISMFCGAMAFVFRGLRWRHLILPLDSTTRRVTSINGINIGNVANMVIQFSGEFIRCGVISRHSKRDPETGKPLATYDRVVGTALLERILDVLSVIFLVLVLMIFRGKEFGGFIADKVVAPIAGRLSWGLWVVIGLLAAACVAFFVIVVKMRERSKFCGKVYDVFSRLLQGLGSFRTMDHKLLFIVYTALIWAMYWFQVVFIAEAMPSVVGLDIVDSLFIMLVGSFASLVPVPGGFGAYHYLVSIALFSIYGLPQATVGIVFATLAHESQALTMIITGLASYIYESFDKRIND